MIVKEPEISASEDKFIKAGQVAEKQMAFYLRRVYGNDQNLRIFHDLRLEKDNEAAQIDHLILHQYGFIIVESKSVTTQIQVNEYGEWIRWFNNTPKGMPSPILQALRQGDFLKEYLEAHAEVLLEKFLGSQTHFGRMHLDILVAISDSGIINRPQNLALDEVCKADQVPQKIQAVFEKRRQENSLSNFNFRQPGDFFSEDELSKITEFLLRHHKPLMPKISAESSATPPPVSKPKPKIKTSAESSATLPPPVSKPKPKIKTSAESSATPSPISQTQPQNRTSIKPDSQPVCRHCQSNDLVVVHGQYGYYFKCRQCKGNTTINALCPVCNIKQRIHKDGIQFYAECEICQTSVLFYTNPVSSAKKKDQIKSEILNEALSSIIRNLRNW